MLTYIAGLFFSLILGGGGGGGGEESFMLTRGLEIGLPASVSGYAHAFSCTDMVSCSICPHFNCRRRMLLTGRR